MKPTKNKRPKPVKEQIPTLPLNEAEIKEASLYWNERGAGLFVPAFLFVLLVGWVVYHNTTNGIEIDLELDEGAFWGLIVFIVVAVIYLAEFLNLMADMQRRQKIAVEGIFIQNGDIHQSTGYITQKIGKQILIFPPKIYHGLTKGDYVKVYCTSILKIVVICEIISRK